MKKQTLAITALVALMNIGPVKANSASQAYEGANCKNVMNIEQAIFISKFDVIRSKDKQIKLLSSEIESLHKKITLLSTNGNEQEEIDKLDKKIDDLLDDIFEIELSIAKEKKRLKNQLSSDEKDLIAADNSFVMSEDCKTMYVLPPAHGNATIMAASFLGGINMCSTYNFYDDMVKFSRDQITSLQEKMILAATSQERNQLRKELLLEQASLKATIEEKGTLGGYTAFSSNILFESRWNELVREYSVRNSGIKVAKMTITDSKLRTNTKDNSPTGDEDVFNGVSHFGVPGLSVNNPLKDYVFFNGSKSGLLQLNLHAACTLKEALGTGFDFRNKTLEQVNAAVSNYTNSTFATDVEFNYPVISKKGYKVEINEGRLKQFHEDFMKQKINHDAKSVYEGMFGNESESVVKVTMYNQGTDVDGEINEEYLLELKDKIQDKITREYLTEFANPVKDSLKLMKQSNNTAAVTVPSNNWKNITKTNRICRRVARRVFGIRVGSRNRCWNQNYTVKQYFRVSSQAQNEFLASFSKKLTEEFESNSAVLRTATMGFVRKGE